MRITNSVSRVEAFERWIRIVAEEEEGKQHGDMSLIARQVFNELKSDPSFSWLSQFLNISSSDERGLGVSLGVAYRLLRFTSPTLSASTVQYVVATLVSMNDTRRLAQAIRGHYLSQSESVYAEGWHGDISVVHLGLTVLSWIACRCCSIVDVVVTFADTFQQYFLDCQSVARHARSDRDYDRCFGSNGLSLEDWVMDRWLAEWSGDRDTHSQTPPPTLSSSPQRSAHASTHDLFAAGDDITPVKAQAGPSSAMVTQDMDHCVMMSGERQAANCYEQGHNANTIDQPRLEPDSNEPAVQELMSVLLAHCTTPLLNHLLEECREECEEDCPEDQLEWSLLHRVATRWDVGVGATFCSSYVSKLAANYFNATQWLLGSESSDVNNSSFVPNVSLVSAEIVQKVIKSATTSIAEQRVTTPVAVEPLPEPPQSQMEPPSLAVGTSPCNSGSFEKVESMTARHRILDPPKRNQVEVAERGEPAHQVEQEQLRSRRIADDRSPEVSDTIKNYPRRKSSMKYEVDTVVGDEPQSNDSTQPACGGCCALM